MSAHVADFQDTDVGPIPTDWRLKELGDLADYLNGAAFKPSDWEEEGLPIIRIQNLTGSSEKFNYFAGDKPDRYKVEDGDLLISWSASLGAFIWNGGSAWLNQHIFKVAHISDNVDKHFLFFAIQHHIGLLTSQTRGSTMKHIVRKAFLATRIPLPPLAEQRRIAAVLNAIQDAIAAQEDVIAAARELKRSLMQRLFTYGPYREPAETKETEIGEIPTHWISTTVGALANISHGYSFKSKFFTEQGPIVLTPGNFKLDGGLYWGPKTKYTCEQFDDVFVLNDGDLVVVMTDLTPTAKLLGGPGFVPSGITILHNQRIGKVIVKRKEVSAEYLYWLFLTEPFKTYMRLTATGSTVKHTSPTRIRQYSFGLPKPDEQQKTVDILNRCDAKIAAEEDRLTALQALFKSMLHQLMTGQIRLLDDEALPISPEADDGRETMGV